MSRFAQFNCAFCEIRSEKQTGHVTRSTKIGAPLYCGKTCAGLARRKHKSRQQQKVEKAAYDVGYRIANLEKIKANKAAHHKATYDPKSAAEQRKVRMSAHIEYCRRPEYKKWKAQYDRVYRAEREYGEFAEAFLLTLKIREEALSRLTDTEIRIANGTFNKALQRRRDYENIVGR